MTVTAPTSIRRRSLSFALAAVAAVVGSIQMLPAISAAAANTAQRTSWNATSTQRYQLWNNDGAGWEEMDASRLVLSVKPSVDSDAVLSANSDLFTTTAGVNTDLAILVNNVVVTWKEAGGYSSLKPAAVFVQAEYAMKADTTYSVALYWKTNIPQPAGTFSQAGAGSPPAFSPTILSAELTPSSLSYVAHAASASSFQGQTSSQSWTPVDPNGTLQAGVLTGSGSYDALITANVDTWAGTAGVNQDLGICYVPAAYFGSACLAGLSAPAAYQENGAASTYMPIASLVQTHVVLQPNTNYEFGIVWKANGAGTIFAGAGGTGDFSPSSLIVQLTPQADAQVSASAQASQESRPYSSSDPGTAWEPVPSVAPLTVSPTSNQLVYLAGNATLFANAGGFNMDLGICVTTGTNVCDGAGTYIAGWKESGATTSWTPDASFLQLPYYMLGGSTYTVTLEWRTNGAMSSGQVMYAGTNTSPNATTLTALQVPSSAPSAPQSVSVTTAPGQATVSWTPPLSSPGSPLSGYAIRPYLGSTALETENVGLVSSLTVPNLANGQTYTFTVAAINGYGAGPTVTTSAVTPGLPGAPTAVSAGSPGNGTVVVSWTAPASSGASALTGYAITTSPATTTTYSWGTGTSATVAGLTNGSTYTFSVAAMNVFGSSAPGTSAVAGPQATAPGSPTAVVGTAGNGSASVAWTAPATNGGSAITSYSVTPYIGGTAQAPTSATSSPATVSALTNGTAYTFTVTANNAAGSSPESAHSLTVIPAATPVVPSVALTVGQNYGIGMQVAYQAVITTNAGVATTVNFTDTLPNGLSGVGTAIQVSGKACATPVVCTGTATSISISSLSVPPQGVVVLYTVTATGSQRSCAIDADSATATIASGNSFTASAPVTVCDSDLGSNAWNSYITQTLGDGGSAAVNPANGNLSVAQTDAIPMATASAATFHLSRTYNSQDTNLAGLTSAEPLGTGWITSFVDLGTQPGGVGLIPQGSGVANGPPVTLVDTSGSRYVFTPSTITPITVPTVASGVLGALLPRVLTKDTGYHGICVDEALSSPAGVHEAMWRYIETTALFGCGTVSNRSVLGYATLGVDRVRHEYDGGGRLLDIADPSGNDFRYMYGSFGLSAVTEHATGRAFTLTYGNTVTVKDPGGETTTYTLTNGTLTSVANPDGTGLSYAYSTCSGAASGQLCSAVDGRGNATTFTYSAAPVGPPRVATITDRNGNVTTITYNATNVTADRSSSLSWNPVSERTNYAAIDAAGRVGELDKGTTANSWLHQTFYGWDTTAAGCRQPEAGLDNDLCSIVRRGLVASAADRVTYYTYGDEGQMLSQRELNYPDDLWTTAGYQEQYFESGATVSAYTDSVAGSGTVTSTTQTGGRRDATTIFDVISQTQSLSPRGNAAGSSFSTYLTTDTNDAKAVSPGFTSGGPCANPAVPSSNTGLLCETAAPSYDGTHATTTFTTYTTAGQRSTLKTPNGNTYTFGYDGSSDKDLSGTTSAMGWLKSITDPKGYFEVLAYDAEGHTARVWDRDATTADSVALSSVDWNTAADGSLVPHYTETTYAAGENFASPGRYPVASETPQAEVSTSTYDANGNLLGSRTAVGTGGSFTSTPVCPQQSSQTFDTCRSYSKNDDLTNVQGPTQAFATPGTTYAYDAFDNRVQTTDANGKKSYVYYDAVNRPVETMASRGDARYVGSSNYCQVSTGADPFFYQFASVCYTNTSYDGVDNTISTSTTDNNQNPTLRLFDAAHRLIETIAPRNDGTYADLETVMNYDEDGDVTDVCPPREFSEGLADGYACTSTATYGVHTTYNPLNKKASSYDYSLLNGASSVSRVTTSTYGYDGDGNQVSNTNGNGFTTAYTYDTDDNKASMTVPRDSSHSYTTTYLEDPSGAQIAEYAPIAGSGTRNFEWSYDFDHRVVYAITGASAPPPDNNLYSAAAGSDVRTENIYDADGNIVRQFTPNAFTGSGTLANPNAVYSVAATYNAADQQTAVYKPRYDTVTLTDPVGSGQSPTQAAECPVIGQNSLGFPPTTGVCTSTYQYDGVGNLAKTTWPTDPSGNTATSNLYTDDNRLYQTLSPSPVNGSSEATATYTYDAAGKQTSVTDANGLATWITYTADELEASTTAAPNGTITHVTSYGYDTNGDKVATTDAVGNVATAAYLPNGLVQSSTDADGDVTSYYYDADGNATSVFSPSANRRDSTNPSGVPTYNAFSEDNLLVSTTYPVGTIGSPVVTRSTCYFYDQSGRKTGQGNGITPTYGPTYNCPSTPGANSFAYSYGVDDRLASETGRNGSTQLTFSYDAAGNQVSSSDGTSGITTSSSYYADSLLRTANDGAGRTTNYAYDGAGKVTGRASVPTSGTTYTDTLTYSSADLESNEATSVVHGFGSTSWSYDAGGRLTAEAYGNGSNLTYSYAPDGTLSQEALWNGAVGTSTEESAFTQALDGDYRVTADGCVCLDGGTGQPIGHSFGYAYDAAGRLIYIAASGGAGAFQTYDADGNRLIHTDAVTGAITTYTYSADDSLMTTTKNGVTTQSTYDGFGGGTLASDGCTTNTLDAFDRTSQYAAVSSPPSSCTSPAPSQTNYSHDAAGNVVSIIVGSTTTTVHSDPLVGGSSVETATNGSGTTETAYSRDSRGVPVALTTGSTIEWLTNDPKGDASTTMNGSHSVQCQIQYDPYGTTVFGRTSSNPCEGGSGTTSDGLLYQDGRRDQSSGTYQLGSRTYDPSKNTFIQPDHFQTGAPGRDLQLGTDPLTRNVYGFVDGDPVNLMDPTGHGACAGQSPASCLPPPPSNGTYTPDQINAAAAAAAAESTASWSPPPPPPCSQCPAPPPGTPAGPPSPQDMAAAIDGGIAFIYQMCAPPGTEWPGDLNESTVASCLTGDQFANADSVSGDTLSGALVIPAARAATVGGPLTLPGWAVVALRAGGAAGAVVAALWPSDVGDPAQDSSADQQYKLKSYVASHFGPLSAAVYAARKSGAQNADEYLNELSYYVDHVADPAYGIMPKGGPPRRFPGGRRLAIAAIVTIVGTLAGVETLGCDNDDAACDPNQRRQGPSPWPSPSPSPVVYGPPTP